MVQQIEHAYQTTNDLNLGWRFLYSPKGTISRNTGVAVLGLNPGGSSFESPVASVEAGNAWLSGVEHWPSSNTQRNFTMFFKRLLAHCGVNDIAGFLNNSLTTNLIPFRSQSGNDLTAWSFRWSADFWREHFEVLSSQRLIIAIGNDATRSAYAGLIEIFGSTSKGGDAGVLPAGWGNLKVRYQTFAFGSAATTIVAIPHCSRFETRDPATIRWIADRSAFGVGTADDIGHGSTAPFGVVAGRPT